MKQLTLFEVMNDTKKQKSNSDPEPIGGTVEQQMTPCVFCHVKPITRRRKDGYVQAICPVCRFGCGTYYGIVEHWNKCNDLDWRLKSKTGRG